MGNKLILLKQSLNAGYNKHIAWLIYNTMLLNIYVNADHKLPFTAKCIICTNKQFLLYLEEAPLPGLISPVGVRGRELGDVPLTGIVSLRVGVVVPDPLPAVRLPGVTRR